jgi:glycine/D-amino acid oxidase-like deaminating enzyme
MKAKVVIVGGGVMGVAIAWHCARRADPLAEPIVLLEKKALAAGASGRSGAILRQHYSDRVVAAMARDSLHVYSALERATGRSIGFQRTGVLTLAGPSKPDEIVLIERNVAMQREIGIVTRLVGAREIRRLVPGIAVDEGAVGAYEEGGGGVDPVLTVRAFAALAREHGAVTRIGTACTGLIVRKGRAIGVRTEDGDIEAEQIVIAAGPWTKRFLARAGVDVPLRVVRPEQHFLAMPAGVAGDSPSRAASTIEDRSQAQVSEAPSPARAFDGPSIEGMLDDRLGSTESELAPAAHPVLLDLEHGLYMRCESHASELGLPAPRTRVGRMDHSQDREIADPDELDETVSAEFERWARDSLVRRMPVYRARESVGSIVGLYNMSPDAQALIGPLPELAGVFLVSGFSGHGFKLAPSIGEGVAQMLWGEPVSAFDTEFFSPDRFEKGAARWGRAFGL